FAGHVCSATPAASETYRAGIERIVAVGVADGVVEFSCATVARHNGTGDRRPNGIAESAERLPVEVCGAGDIVPVRMKDDDPRLTLHHLKHRGDLVTLSSRNLKPGLLADPEICGTARNLFDRSGATQRQDFDVDSGLGEIALRLRYHEADVVGVE